MANVMFKRGSQSALQGLIDKKSFTEGTFYLTTDSDRLYFAQSATELVLLNHQVIHVANLNSLPSLAEATVGDFYYVVSENVLCTKSATDATKWVQINKNTNDNDNTKTTDLTFTKSVDTSSKDITLNYTLKQQTSDINGNITNVPDITGSFVIKGTDIASVVTPTSVGVTSSIVGGKAVISTTGEGANTTKKVNIAGKGSVSISGDADNITITGKDTTYSMSSPAASTGITLTETGGESTTITFTSGKQINVSGNTDKEISIAHGEVTTTKPTDTSTIAANGSFTAITEISTDNGHITSYKTNTYNMPATPEYSITGVSADNTGKINVKLKEKNGPEKTTSSGTDLYYIVNNNKVYNQGSIDFYTKDEIDRKINGIDAMVYRGTVGDISNPSLPTDNVHNGDTYKVAAASTYGGHDCKVGDLLIATGVEGDNGIIGDIVWTYVPSGDDTDTTYQLKTANNVISLYNNVTQLDNGTVTLAKGTDMEVSTSGNTITVSHATKSVTTNETISKIISDSDRKFTTITAITDSNGHIASITPTEFTLPADNNTTYTLSTLSDGTNQGIIKLTGSDGSQGTSAVIKAGNLIGVSASSTGITVNHATPTMDTNLKGTDLEPAYGGSFNVITSITKDSYGHVTNYKTSKITLPAARTYGFKNTPTVASVTGGYSVATTLTGSAGDDSTATFSVTSSSLKVSNPSGTTLAVDLEWGSF